MHKVVSVDMERDILEANRRLAEENSKILKEHGVASYDFLGSIGSGKTLLIQRIIERLKEKGVRPGVIAGDVSGNDDYLRFISMGVPAVNINTGKECHLDAHLLDHALEELPLDDIDVLFVENVGNLVCPADFPLGTDMRVVVISVTEGDDMARKHPLIFREASVAVINKIDLAEVMEVDPRTIERDILRIKPSIKCIRTDAKHVQGVDQLMGALGLEP
ncbi:MAG: hydrogenase nickel incorporation protein HypB [Thermoplasmata archaeon]|nr:hydrogenase nickel incorporation protein HypB [Thermoplasmata archaeon]RLF55443.1 MAG: hydrogenase accessory protein HypB [Thermoplasmata archaeon]RLF69171.1 MAG: hydrogenase accessory protein HypB [Thermoplasmata archaeon]RLF71627.1 MAG: hydrogenase accessory protein HypB [Thermoplasmata archaeon]RLF72773.1 MAG: hydrogenase accessory protein HypB [Thermoplasmata archaeon]